MAGLNIYASYGQFVLWCVFSLKFVLVFLNVAALDEVASFVCVGPAGVPPSTTTPSITAALICLSEHKWRRRLEVNDKTVCWNWVSTLSVARSLAAHSAPPGSCVFGDFQVWIPVKRTPRICETFHLACQINPTYVASRRRENVCPVFPASSGSCIRLQSAAELALEACFTPTGFSWNRRVTVYSKEKRPRWIFMVLCFLFFFNCSFIHNWS